MSPPCHLLRAGCGHYRAVVERLAMRIPRYHRLRLLLALMAMLLLSLLVAVGGELKLWL